MEWSSVMELMVLNVYGNKSYNLDFYITVHSYVDSCLHYVLF